MPRPPAMQFYTGDWKKDPNLSACSLSTRGFWIDALCAMHESDRSGTITGTAEQLARTLRCLPSEVHPAADELQATGAASVTIRNGVITLTCRRMNREFNERNSNRLRQERHRNNGKITPSSSSSSSSSDNPLPPGVEFPESLNRPEFLEAWLGWVQYRDERRIKQLGPTATKKALNRLAAMGLHAAIAAIEYSISQNYQGIFEEKIDGKTKSHANQVCKTLSANTDKRFAQQRAETDQAKQAAQATANEVDSLLSSKTMTELNELKNLIISACPENLQQKLAAADPMKSPTLRSMIAEKLKGN